MQCLDDHKRCLDLWNCGSSCGNPNILLDKHLQLNKPAYTYNMAARITHVMYLNQKCA
jgi:hypothetical protein